MLKLTILSTVRNAAKFAVYDEIKMSEKNHQAPPTIRPKINKKRNVNILAEYKLFQK